MGRRLAVLHALTGTPDPATAARRPGSSSPRSGPSCSGWARSGRPAPVVIRPGQQVDVAELLPELVAMGYRREHQVEHRGEFAVRGGIVDVFPSTADVPVRIDLWGDEVDRLTAFSVSDQRSLPRPARRRPLRLPRARRHPGAAARRAPPGDAPALGRGGVGAPGRGRAVRRHGVMAALPRRRRSACCPTCCRREPGRPGRAPPHPRPRRAAARRGGRAGRDAWRPPGAPKRATRRASRACTCPSSGCSSESPAGVTALPPVPEGPDTAALTVRRFDPVAGDPARLAAGVTGLVGQGYAVTLCAATRAGAATALRRAGGRGRARAGRSRPQPGTPGRPAWWRRRSPRVHPARRQGRRAVRDRRHRAAGPAPPGPPAGAGRRRLLRRPRGRQLRRPPPARRGALRGRDDADDGRDHPRLPDPAVPGLGPPVPPRRAD